MIRPPGVTKIKPATGESVGCGRRPDWIRQIRGGFDNDGEVCRPGDGKTESGALKEGIVPNVGNVTSPILDLRQTQVLFQSPLLLLLILPGASERPRAILDL